MNEGVVIKENLIRDEVGDGNECTDFCCHRQSK
jgi:hypothetical protein